MLKIKVTKNILGLLGTALVLNYLVSPPTQQTTGTNPTGGQTPATWTPKWAVGDLIWTHNVSQAYNSWLIQNVNYGLQTYQGRNENMQGVFSFNLSRTVLESSDYYKVN